MLPLQPQKGWQRIFVELAGALVREKLSLEGY